LAREPILEQFPPFYRKASIYHDFCHKYQHEVSSKPAFPSKLAEKKELLGLSGVRTTMIYTHTIKSTTSKEKKSPLDVMENHLANSVSSFFSSARK
jgi:hypothetical protein